MRKATRLGGFYVAQYFFKTRYTIYLYMVTDETKSIYLEYRTGRMFFLFSNLQQNSFVLFRT